MGQLIPSLAALVDGFRGCFRREVFVTFQHLLVGWIVAPGPRTISDVWQASLCGIPHGLLTVCHGRPASNAAGATYPSVE